MISCFEMEGWAAIKSMFAEGQGLTQRSKLFNDGMLSIRQGRCLAECR